MLFCIRGEHTPTPTYKATGGGNQTHCIQKQCLSSGVETNTQAKQPVSAPTSCSWSHCERHLAWSWSSALAQGPANGTCHPCTPSWLAPHQGRPSWAHHLGNIKMCFVEWARPKAGDHRWLWVWVGPPLGVLFLNTNHGQY